MKRSVLVEIFRTKQGDVAFKACNATPLARAVNGVEDHVYEVRVAGPRWLQAREQAIAIVRKRLDLGQISFPD